MDTIAQSASNDQKTLDIKTAALVILAGAVVGSVTIGVADLALGPLTVSFNGAEQLVTIAAAFVSSVVAGLTGAILLVVLNRLTQRAVTIWTVVAGIVLLLSFGGPLSADAATGVKLALITAHALVGITFIALLPRSLRCVS